MTAKRVSTEVTSNPREATPARRVVVKLGTTTLIGGGSEPDPLRIGKIAEQVSALRAQGAVAVIVSSGAIAAGMGPLGLKRRPTDMPTLQAAAAVGQRRVMDIYADALGSHGVLVAQVLLTQYDIVQRSHYVNARNTLERLIELGAVPIVNENDTVATEEIRYGDNDRLAALVANMIRADLLVILSDVEGVYDRDPQKPAARLLSRVEEITPQLLASATRVGPLGSGGMASKLQAARIATLSGVDVVVASGERRNVLLDIWRGAEVGTYFPVRRSRIQARKLWIAWAPTARGRIVIDEGAKRALTDGKKSLLAAGVKVVEGTFQAGDAVNVVGPEGETVAKGLVRFDSELLSEVAGTKGGREVIHRDQMVLL
ncbi:MAG: glutamate 5-kinase [Actinomycetota bacterium]